MERGGLRGTRRTEGSRGGPKGKRRIEGRRDQGCYQLHSSVSTVYLHEY